jgi:hypothetical protein
LEGIARQMRAADPALEAELDKRLKDEAFAADPRARLRFFYERSPYFDSAWKRHPLLPLDAEALGVLLARCAGCKPGGGPPRPGEGWGPVRLRPRGRAAMAACAGMRC